MTYSQQKYIKIIGWLLIFSVILYVPYFVVTESKKLRAEQKQAALEMIEITSRLDPANPETFNLDFKAESDLANLYLDYLQEGYVNYVTLVDKSQENEIVDFSKQEDYSDLQKLEAVKNYHNKVFTVHDNYYEAWMDLHRIYQTQFEELADKKSEVEKIYSDIFGDSCMKQILVMKKLQTQEEKTYEAYIEYIDFLIENRSSILPAKEGITMSDPYLLDKQVKLYEQEGKNSQKLKEIMQQLEEKQIKVFESSVQQFETQLKELKILDK